jgi:aminoglycoside phosphotransferase family enzyme/predicted kinase
MTTDRSQDQEPVFAFLADPATHGGHPVRRIDTHAAVVFLAGDRVLKVKRAVRFPFLDYSTLERRRHFCAREIEVNRRFAPELYRGVVAIGRAPDGTLSIGEDGEPVEYAVEMARFDEAKTLDHLAESSGIGEQLADDLGRSVVAAHRDAPAIEPEPWIAALNSYREQDTAAFRALPELFAPDDVQALDHMAREACVRLAPLLRARGRAGLVRQLHGDLHLGNIVLCDGRPVLFDAIEFDPLVASGDVLYDLAFLLMDLVQRGLALPANIVLNRYLADARRRDDLDGLAALPFFQSIRAAIRAKVTAARLDHAAASEREAIAALARSYFALACDLLKPARPTLVAIGGLSGTGKSRLGRLLAPTLAPAPGAVILRSDVVRKARFDVAETDKLPAGAYTADVTAGVYAALTTDMQRAVAAGYSVIVDAVFAHAEERDALRDAAGSCGINLHGLFLTADLETRLARIGSRGADASDADAEVARGQQSYELGAMDWIPVDASGTPDETLERARVALALNGDARASP